MLDKAIKKLEAKGIGGQKERAMAPAVAAALQDFCRQDEEFAQAVAQGGSFAGCMKEVAKGVGGSISDIDAYKKAVRFYFPGADISVKMTIDLIGDAGTTDERTAASAAPPCNDSGKPVGIILNLEDFL